MFSEPFIFADDLKILAVQRSYWEVQDDLHGIENWIIQNKMELAIDKCAYLNFRGRNEQYKLMGKDLAKSTTVKDLGIHVAADVSWKQHIEERMKKENKVLYMLKRNVATKVNTIVKLGLYKSWILPVLLYDFTCLTAGRTEIQILEKFQKKVVKWITGNEDTEYKSQLRLLNILPLPMFIQLNDLLLVSKALNEENSGIELPEVHTKETRNNEIQNLEQRKRAANSPLKPVELQTA